MVSAGGKLPWHKLGTVLADAALDVPTAVKAAKLDWTVDKESVFDGEGADLEDYRLLRRSDTKQVLSIVPHNWTPLQNVQLLEIAEALAQAPGIGDFKPVIETAGSLRGGKVVWALVQTSQRQFAGSNHEQYLLLTNGHYLGRGIRGTLTDVRVVCNNTLSAAELAKSSLFTTHYGDPARRLQRAIEVIGWATEATNATFSIYSALQKTPCTRDQAVKVFTGLFKMDEVLKRYSDSDSEKIEGMLHLFKEGAGCEGKTAFDVVNAVTDWVDHQKSYREDSETAERRFMDISVEGDGVHLKRKAMTLAKQLVLA